MATTPTILSMQQCVVEKRQDLAQQRIVEASQTFDKVQKSTMVQEDLSTTILFLKKSFVVLCCVVCKA